MKSKTLTLVPDRAGRRLKASLRAFRETLPLAVLALGTYFLWHTGAIPVYAKTSLLTLVGGVILLLVGQFFQKGVMEPFQEMQRTIGEVGAALLVYANVADEVVREDLQQEARVAFRRLAGELAGKRRALGYYGVFAKLEMLPAKENTVKALRDLVLMSNSVGTGNHDTFDAARDRIKLALWLDL